MPDDCPAYRGKQTDGRQESGAERLINKGGVRMSEEKYYQQGSDDEALKEHPRAREDDLRDRCRNERESLEPHETADCAGQGLAEMYENEEDGGS